MYGEQSEGNPLALMRLLQLASPSLPVGAYSYSQGLEAAIAARLVHNEATSRIWIKAALRHAVAQLEAPIFVRAYGAWQAWTAQNDSGFSDWNDWFLATRDTAEFRAETVQMGYSLLRWMRDLAMLEESRQNYLFGLSEVAAPCAFAAASATLSVPLSLALEAYLFSWLENQILAAVKAVPLGQAAGQRLLLALSEDIPALAARAINLPDAAMSNWTPGLTQLSIAHETQYSRIFRS